MPTDQPNPQPLIQSAKVYNLKIHIPADFRRKFSLDDGVTLIFREFEYEGRPAILLELPPPPPPPDKKSFNIRGILK